MFFVRTASEKDLPAVSSLLGAVWHASYDGLYGAERVGAITRDWHSVAALQAQIRRTDSDFLVADDGKRLGGMGYAAMMPGQPDTVMLHQLYVLPAFQGQGLGRDMFAELETCFPKAQRMRLEVAPDNARAIAFYAGLGFVEVGRTANCGRDQSGLPALIMEKRLAF